MTDEMVQQFADAKARAQESGGGDEGVSSEESENTSVEIAEGEDGGEEEGAASGGDPADQAPVLTTEPESESADVVGDVSSTVPTDPVEAAAYWRGVAEREEKRRRDMQSHTDRQLVEANTKIEALEQLWDTEDAEYEQRQAAQAAAAALPADEQLDTWVQVAPADAFQKYMMSAPDRMGELIESVYRVHGPELGVQAQQAYDRALDQARIYQAEQRLEQKIQQIEAPAKKQAEFLQAIAEVKAKYPADELENLAPRVRELLGTQGYYDQERLKYASTAAFIEAQYLRAYRETSVQGAVQQAANPVQKVVVPHVETGSGAAVVEPEKSYSQTKAERLLAVHQHGRTYG
jgi:hypothetical protein